MYAHVTTIPAEADRLDEGIRAFGAQVVPPLHDHPGFRGAYLLVDRQQGRAVAIAAWESHEAMRQSEPAVARRRAEAVRRMGGTTPTVERYDVAFTDGRGVGRYARATLGYTTAATMNHVLRYVRQQELPTLRSVPGFGGLLQLVNRRAGTVLGVAFFESAEALARATAMAGRMRTGAERVGLRGTDAAAPYEVALRVWRPAED